MNTQSNNILKTLKAFTLVAVSVGVVAGIFDLRASNGHQPSAPALSAFGNAWTADRPVRTEINSQRRVRATLCPRQSKSSFNAELPELGSSNCVEAIDTLYQSPGDILNCWSDIYGARFEVSSCDPYASKLPRWIGDFVEWKSSSLPFADRRHTAVGDLGPAGRPENAQVLAFCDACEIVLTDHPSQPFQADHSIAEGPGDQITTTDVVLDRQSGRTPSGPETAYPSRVAGMLCIDGKATYA
ncbi:MAG: hypothetical protein AAF317_10650 [Pseudomonadota bacterium]